MIKLTIIDKEFILADEWGDITFGQYISLFEINKGDFTENQKALKIISAISDNPNECEFELGNLDVHSFAEIAKQFEWTNETIDKYKAQAKDSFVIDGKNYRIRSDYNNLTLGDMINIETILQDNKELDPLEIAFGMLLRELDANGKEIPFSMEGFNYIVFELRNKVKLLDIYKHLVFFSIGGTKSTNETTKAYSIQKL